MMFTIYLERPLSARVTIVRDFKFNRVVDGVPVRKVREVDTGHPKLNKRQFS
jgi:hypothetical protein